MYTVYYAQTNLTQNNWVKDGSFPSLEEAENHVKTHADIIHDVPPSFKPNETVIAGNDTYENSLGGIEISHEWIIKREIKPHKGGRSERVYARLTPDEKTRLSEILAREKLSLSDWIVSQFEAKAK